MDKHKRYLEAIRRAYPDFSIGSAVLNLDGQNNDVLIVNGEYVFRFPRYPEALERLACETTILTGIRGYVPLEVPDPRFVNLEAQEIGKAFVGYRMIPGEPLWRETLARITDEAELDRLAAQLGEFLQALHGVPFQEAIACPLRVADTYDEWAGIYARIREKLFPSMRPDARAWAARHFETFLETPGAFTFDRVLCHGDFGASNILYDAGAGAICGIIDFGSAGLGDPAGDFAGLLASYGEDFLRRVARAYPAIDAVWERVRFYQGTFALYEALFGIENGDEEAFRAGMAQFI